MASLERIFLPRETDAYGMLWWGAMPGVTGGHVLRISSCHVLLCGCDRENQYFMVRKGREGGMVGKGRTKEGTEERKGES